MPLTRSSGQSLPDDYIYKPYSDKFAKVLYALPRSSILQLVQHWLSDPLCEPPLDWSEIDIDSDDSDSDSDSDSEEKAKIHKQRIIEILKEEYQSLKDSPLSKRSIVQRILYDHWRNGLNMAQIAQIDIASFAEKTSGNTPYSWTYSTVYEASGEAQTPLHEHIVSNIEPNSFLTRFNEALYPLFVGHVSAHQHSKLSVIILRVQIFEEQSISVLRKDRLMAMGSDKFRITVPPIFIAFPLSSPHIIHSHFRLASSQNYIKAILQALVITLSRPSRAVTVQSTHELPTKSFDCFIKLKGVRRGVAALGPWARFGRGNAEPGALSLIPNPARLKRKRSKKEQVSQLAEKYTLDPQTKKRKLVDVRFHGQQAVANNESASDEDDDDDDDMVITFAKVPTFEVKVKEPYKDIQGDYTAPAFSPTVTTRFEGTNVFQGLKMLAMTDILDIERAPKWLTEQQNTTSATVINGDFKIGLKKV